MTGAEQLFRVEPRIQYVAINLGWAATYNSTETDRLEELVVNPIVLASRDAAARSTSAARASLLASFLAATPEVENRSSDE